VPDERGDGSERGLFTTKGTKNTKEFTKVRALLV
jgi:hypothetical protein